jgi:hypothetical protein
MASLVTNAGFAHFTAAILASNIMRYLQWGVGSGQTAASNTVADTTGTTEARTAGALSQQTTTVANDTIRCVGTITALAALAITEVGVHDAAGTGTPPTGGNMDVYGDFSVINLAPGDSITFTVNVKFS